MMQLPTRFVLLMIPRPPRSTLFPYTTLLRSLMADQRHRQVAVKGQAMRGVAAELSARFLVSHGWFVRSPWSVATTKRPLPVRSEEHTSELQSRQYLVCRLLLANKYIVCRLLL